MHKEIKNMANVTDRFGNPVTDSKGNAVTSGNVRVPTPGQSSGTVAAASVQNLVGSSLRQGADGLKNSVIGAAKQRVTDFVSDTGFGKALRALNLLPGAMPTGISFTDGNWGSNNELDWRVRLSVPSTFSGSPLLAPLLETGGMVFPYTPQVLISHRASYNPITPVHSNYAYFAYQNSEVNEMTITGDFLIENALEGEYWIGVVHYLRSVTKMAYGRTSNQGAPPPVVRLNGYGDYVFKNVPVIITQFTVDLQPNVDYIQVGLGANGSWVPTASSIAVTVQPIYSRRQVSQFSLDGFVRGDYVLNGKGFI